MELKYFGDFLRELRLKNNYTYEYIADKLNMINVDANKIKRWEHDLDFPDLDCIYKLSDFFNVPASELLAYKQFSLDEGMKHVHVKLIRFISFILGVSMYTVIYGTIWGFRIFAFLFILYLMIAIGTMGAKL